MSAHGHGHSHGSGGAGLSLSGRVRRWMVTIAVAVAVVCAGGTVDLWPTGHRPAAPQAATGGAQQVVHARVAAIRQRTCAGTVENRLPDGDIPAKVSCPTARVHLSSGPDAGRSTTVDVPAQVARGGIDAGDQVDLTLFPPSDGQARTYAWLDFSRTVPLAVIVAVFAVVVVVLGRRRG